MATCISLNETLWDYGDLAFLIVLVHLTFLYCLDRGDLNFFKPNLSLKLGLWRPAFL